MDELFNSHCKNRAITRLAVGCLKRVLTLTASRIVGVSVQHPLHYEGLKNHVSSQIPSSLASLAMSHAKALSRTKRPKPCFPHLSKTANIVLYLVLEYILLEILELSRIAASGHRRILPRHIRMAVLLDDDLKALLHNQRTALFFQEDRVDPLMGSLIKTKMTKQCLCTDFIRKRGECSLPHSDKDVRMQLGSFRMYSRLHKNVVVAFLLVSKHENGFLVNYGFHQKCFGVWKGMLKRLLRFSDSDKDIVVPLATSLQMKTFLASVGFVDKKSMYFYNHHEAKNLLSDRAKGDFSENS